MSKVKLMVDDSNTDVCLRLTEFFRNQDIEFEIVALQKIDAEGNGLLAAGQVSYEPSELSFADKDNENTVKAVKVLQDFANTKIDKKLDERISNIFITVGIPAHIKGYQFLREAVKLTIEKPEIINSITKQLYPAIAQKFKTSASKVERAIRHAIEVGWNRGRVDHINNIFGVRAFDVKDKPTNGEFIAIVADKMILEGA